MSEPESKVFNRLPHEAMAGISYEEQVELILFPSRIMSIGERIFNDIQTEEIHEEASILSNFVIFKQESKPAELFGADAITVEDIGCVGGSFAKRYGQFVVATVSLTIEGCPYVPPDIEQVIQEHKITADNLINGYYKNLFAIYAGGEMLPTAVSDLLLGQAISSITNDEMRHIRQHNIPVEIYAISKMKDLRMPVRSLTVDEVGCLLDHVSSATYLAGKSVS